MQRMEKEKKNKYDRNVLVYTLQKGLPDSIKNACELIEEKIEKLYKISNYKDLSPEQMVQVEKCFKRAFEIINRSYESSPNEKFRTCAKLWFDFALRVSDRSHDKEIAAYTKVIECLEQIPYKNLSDKDKRLYAMTFWNLYQEYEERGAKIAALSKAIEWRECIAEYKEKDTREIMYEHFLRCELMDYPANLIPACQEKLDDLQDIEKYRVQSEAIDTFRKGVYKKLLEGETFKQRVAELEKQVQDLTVENNELKKSQALPHKKQKSLLGIPQTMFDASKPKAVDAANAAENLIDRPVNSM